jgi:GH43 family beta-xylosidase
MKKIVKSSGNSKPRDPFIFKHKNKYYHCFTEDCLTISISCADTIEELESAKPKTVYIPDKEEYSKELWAPELHIIDNKCYIYVACDDGNNYNHRMYVLENESANPMDEYKMHGKITDVSDKWAIDGNVFYINNQLYFVWSGWEGNRNVRQNIYIAKMSDPYTISSNRVLISTPDYDWEKIGCTPEDIEGKPYINEGPFGFCHNSEFYIAYSASGSWSVGYCIAFLKLVGNDPMDIKSWYKYNKPVLVSNEQVKGAGHCSIIDEGYKKNIFFHGWDINCEEIRWNTVDAWMGELIIENDEIKIV